MEQGLYQLLSVIVASITTIISFLIYFFNKREERKKFYANVKEQREQKEKELEHQVRENRKQVLISFIKDEKVPESTRILAAKEYLESGYNGMIKDYIDKNEIFKK